MKKETPSVLNDTEQLFPKVLAAVSLALLGATLAANAGQGPQPSICQRACWGARAAGCSSMAALTRATIHHTAGSGDWTTSNETGKAVMRGVQNMHMDSLGWCDIAYHFLVNAGGHIYEGRAGSMTGLPRGAHDACNSDSFGFTVLGYYHPPVNQTFTTASLNSLMDVIAWRMPSSWSPYGSGTYCGSNTGWLDGHRKVVATACPGDGVYAYITDNRNGGPIRDGVNARKNPAPANNPPYLFDSTVQGWSAGNAMNAVNWTASGWPGIIYGNQIGNDAYIYGPACSFVGPGQPVINVSVYAQYGNTASHDMQMFWTTAADPSWTASKSTTQVPYALQNNWAWINLDASIAPFAGQTITQLRLDFDQVNHGNTWVVNHVVVQSTLRWDFSGDTMRWIPGSGVSAINWTATGWPGVIYFMQTGIDAYIYSTDFFFNTAGPFRFIGGVNDTIRVRVYPEGGTTAAHDMQVFWITSTDTTWTASKSSAIVNYTGQNQWVEVSIPVGVAPGWQGSQIRDIRLDFDQANHGNRWIVDYVNFLH